MPSTLSVSLSDSLRQFDGTGPDEESLRRLSCVRIQLEIDASADPSMRTTIIRLAERHVPGVPGFIIAEDNGLVLRLCHSDIRSLHVDQLACRLARLKGVRRISAEHRRTGEGTVYAARIRGR